jgi:NAD+-dependent protein deacetylase sirtuin 4
MKVLFNVSAIVLICSYLMKIGHSFNILCNRARFQRCFSATINLPNIQSSISFNTPRPPIDISSFAESLPSPQENDIEQLVNFFKKSSKLVAITGAGTSTNSGIPDYRGPAGSYKKGHKPITHQDFLKSELTRKRYWMRSMLGWNRFSLAKPNAAHYSLATLEAMRTLQCIVTQNVDRLHSRAGSQTVIDLHGRIDKVKCLCCDMSYSRRMMQQWLLSLNTPIVNQFQHLLYPMYHDDVHNNENQSSFSTQLLNNHSKMRADGDMEVHIDDYSKIIIPSCPKCKTGILKPDVVFFGDNVPLPRVTAIQEHIDTCDALLVIGSSLEVYSAYRFVDRANKRHVPIAIINFGETRAERQQLENIVFKSEANCAILLKAAIDELG